MTSMAAREMGTWGGGGRFLTSSHVGLRSGRLKPGGTDRMIVDLCDMSPDPQPAPEWASQRLQRYGKNGGI